MSSGDAPGQFVNSNSWRCRNWIKFDKPLDVSNGQPAKDRICMLLMPQMCCKPKSRICVHHLRNSVFNANIVEMYPMPISVIWTHLSKVNSSKWFKSHAIYSSAASVTLGHHDTSRDLNFRKFSAMSSIPSSVTLEHPDKDKTVKFGNVWTILTIPWFVISQQDWSLNTFNVPVCFGLK